MTEVKWTPTPGQCLVCLKGLAPDEVHAVWFNAFRHTYSCEGGVTVVREKLHPYGGLDNQPISPDPQQEDLVPDPQQEDLDFDKLISSASNQSSLNLGQLYKSAMQAGVIQPTAHYHN